MTLSISEEQILLKQDWKSIRSLLEEKNQRLDELSKKCALYENGKLLNVFPSKSKTKNAKY